MSVDIGPARVEEIPPSSRETSRRGRQWGLRAAQFIIVAAFLTAWEYLPRIHALSQNVRFLDPFFISSPSAVVSTLWGFMTASGGRPYIWPYLWDTLSSALLGTFIGIGLGAAVGLVLSNSPRTYELLRPFIVALNAVPRIAIIPIFVILLGPSKSAAVVTAVTVVFFVVFFNALEGGRTVPAEMLNNVRLLGGSRTEVMVHVRLPFVLAWTVAVLPNAVSFGLLIVVAAEVFVGSQGMGRLLMDSVSTLQPELTFAVVMTLSVVGIALVAIADKVTERWLHWWVQEQ